MTIVYCTKLNGAVRKTVNDVLKFYVFYRFTVIFIFDVLFIRFLLYIFIILSFFV